MMRLASSLAFLLLIIRSTGGHALPRLETTPMEADLETTKLLLDLESADDGVRHAAVEHILHSRNVEHRYIQALAERHVQGGKGYVARDALGLLGRLQARDQIPYLVSRIDYVVPVVGISMEQLPSIERTFPAAGALIDLGLPAIKPVLERLSQVDDDDEVLIAGAGVLSGVLGRAAAIKRLRRERDLARDTKARDAFDRALDLFESEFVLQ